MTSMTDTVSVPLFATYAVLPSGVNATEIGKSPTLIVEVTLGAAKAGAGTETTTINDNSTSDTARLRIVMVIMVIMVGILFRKMFSLSILSDKTHVHKSKTLVPTVVARGAASKKNAGRSYSSVVA